MNAQHGWWCNAVTWHTKCPSCRERVFFFHCDCGSKVFFDALGPPWPIHDCETSWTRDLVRNRDRLGAITVEITPGVTVRRAPEGSIHESVVSAAKRRQRQSDPIVAIDPAGAGEVRVIGVLRECRVVVDVARALKLSCPTAMMSGFLGRLGRGQWGKVTIHQQSPIEGVLHSYTAWVPNEILSAAKGTKDVGVTVRAGITSYSVRGVGSYWICDSYELVR